MDDSGRSGDATQKSDQYGDGQHRTARGRNGDAQGMGAGRTATDTATGGGDGRRKMDAGANRRDDGSVEMAIRETKGWTTDSRGRRHHPPHLTHPEHTPHRHHRPPPPTRPLRHTSTLSRRTSPLLLRPTCPSTAEDATPCGRPTRTGPWHDGRGGQTATPTLAKDHALDPRQHIRLGTRTHMAQDGGGRSSSDGSEHRDP